MHAFKDFGKLHIEVGLLAQARFKKNFIQHR